MTHDLASIRRALIRVSSDLKQDRLLPAAMAIQAAARALLRMPLLKNEQEELSRMLQESCELLQQNEELRKIFALAIPCKPKEEALLVETLGELISILESEAAAQMQSSLQALEERQRNQLEKGKKELDAKKYDAARVTFGTLYAEFEEDGELITEIGDAFLQAGLFDDAAQYLNDASEKLPGSAHVLNRLGIALRRLGRFDAAEAKFRMALEMENNDPNLYFNLGRLYLDTKKWENCMICAQKALGLEPSFTQASQMIAYCSRMLKAPEAN